jgi:hypothetical protein
MRAGLSFSRSPISLLLRQPLSIKKSYAGAIQNYLITIMFLQKLHTFKRNPNRAEQKLSAAVTKLCAVTKLGDLTVPF